MIKEAFAALLFLWLLWLLVNNLKTLFARDSKCYHV